MRTKAYYNVVVCDNCKTTRNDVSQWYKIKGLIDFSDYNGYVNQDLNKFDFCREQCAQAWLNKHVAEITKVVDNNSNKPS